MPTVKTKPHIIFRLVLAKALFESGMQLCDTTVDIYTFSHGLITLHDALDNFAGAIATHLNVHLKQDTSLFKTLDSIQKHERMIAPTFTWTNENELAQLNTIRNSIKHQGIIPNITHARPLIQSVVAFFREYSLHYFKLEWEFISLVDLVTDKKTQVSLREAESLMHTQQYKEALDKMAVIKFQVFDERLLRQELNPRHDLLPESEETKELRASSNIFRRQANGLFADLYDRTKFLEKGIDHDLMKQFEVFTAEVGINNTKEWTYILRHGAFWGETNWTREISVFCFDFLIESIIKYQDRYQITKRTRIMQRHTIRTTDDLEIHDSEGMVTYTMSKGEERDAVLFGRVDGKWEIFDRDDRFVALYSVLGKDVVTGYFEKGKESNIEFLKTQEFIEDETGNLVLLKVIA